MRMVSPMFASMRGIGHCPLMPMVVRSKAPSGFAVTQPTLKSCDTVAALIRGRNEEARAKYSAFLKLAMAADFSPNEADEPSNVGLGERAKLMRLSQSSGARWGGGHSK